MKIMKHIIASEKLDMFSKLVSAILNGALDPKKLNCSNKKLSIKDRYDSIVSNQDEFDDQRLLLCELFNYSIFSK